MNATRTQLLNINFITCSKVRYRTHAPKIDPSLTFHKITQAVTIFIIVFIDSGRTDLLPCINSLAYSKAKI